MALKLIIDVNVGHKIEQWLTANAYDVRLIRDLDPRMSDKDILQMAIHEQRIVVTMDKDFGEMVYREGKKHAGVLLLRLEQTPSATKISILSHILANYADQLVGKFAVYQAGRLRIR